MGILEDLATPLGFCWAVLVLSAAWLVLRESTRRRALLPGGLALILFLFGGTPLSAWMLAALERPYAGVKAEALPDADAIVMLGGILGPSANDLYGVDFNAAADRAIAATELLRLGRAPVLVAGGGAMQSLPEKPLESDLWLPWVEAWKLKPRRVHQLGACRNTHDEGMAVKRLMEEHRWKRVILVTSASHMRRAEGVFRRLDIPVDCFAADFRGISTLESGGFRVGVPRPTRLQCANDCLHEVFGWLVYRWRDWVR